MGKREMMDSAIMIANATHSYHEHEERGVRLTIQPRAPFVDEDTLPGAQPACFEMGERIPQPTSIPRFMDSVTGKPIMIP